ncbi:MAG TPA: ABC transporter ATP-binding protein [Bryobacteraceae bacterium]|nr:ABC transporter ATP-binding protein [Bryobacteraceae bacterium]
MSHVAISAHHLSKRYRLGAKQRGYRTIRDSVTDILKKPLNVVRSAFKKSPRIETGEPDHLWALNDVSFEVKTGEVVGVIGRNGAGKSTLLKVLSRITEPTSGYVDVWGRVGSLLEVGTGFHPELTGRENTYLNGAILGMGRAEIDRKFDEIVAFSEIERFIDTPVKHYSSGMYLRLAFAVAAHLEPEILLVDEVLAVGDAAFQRKCTGKMGDVAKQGRTILFVSHNMAAMRQLCSTAILLSAGEIAENGDIDTIIKKYLNSTLSTDVADFSNVQYREGAGDIRFAGMYFEDADGLPATGLISGQSGSIVLRLNMQRAFPRVRVGISFLDSYSQRVMYLNSYFVREDLPEVAPETELVCHIPRVHLAPGRYRVELRLQSSSTVLQDRISDAVSIDVFDGNFFGTGRAGVEGQHLALMDFNWTTREVNEYAGIAEVRTAGRKI